MGQIKKIQRQLKVPCAICGSQTRYKGKEFGYKCYNLKCSSRLLNTIKKGDSNV